MHASNNILRYFLKQKPGLFIRPCGRGTSDKAQKKPPKLRRPLRVTRATKKSPIILKRISWAQSRASWVWLDTKVLALSSSKKTKVFCEFARKVLKHGFIGWKGLFVLLKILCLYFRATFWNPKQTQRQGMTHSQKKTLPLTPASDYFSACKLGKSNKGLLCLAIDASA